MRLNGVLIDSRHDDVDEMVEAESTDMAGRLHDLERKVLEQGDELMCLRATLADVLRRLNQIDGVRQTGTPSPTPHTPHTPLRNGHSSPVSRTPTYIPKGSRRAPSALPQRRAVHYQSTGSLHSADSQSSSSVSPAPSPSPRSTPLPAVPAATAAGQRTQSQGSLQHAKRWSSTGDFNSPVPPALQSSTRDATYNEEDGSVRMFLRGRPIILYAPTSLRDTYDPSKVQRAPASRLRLDWVYGYRGKDCRSNLAYLPTGEMVYFVAAVVVLHNVQEHSQRHYLGHTDDVKCLAIHPNKLVIATGQCAGKEAKPHIRVWNSVSLTTLAVLGMGHIEASVCCLSFSKADGGALLLSIDDAHDHTLTIWEWQRGENGHRLSNTKCSLDTVVSGEFHPLDRGAIVTCGKGHVSFWTYDSTAGTLYKRSGIFEGRDRPKYVTCVAFTAAGDVLTGDSSGNIAVWARHTNTTSRIVKNLHDSAIFSVCVLQDGSVLTGGAKDGRMIHLDGRLNRTGVESRIEPHYGGIRVVSEGRGSQLLVGTTRNCILTGDLHLGFQPAVLGHTDELWALATHPVVPHFATAGHDRLLQLWDSMSHSIVWSKDIGEPVRSAAFSADGSFLAVGAVSGRWLVFDTQTRDMVWQHSDGAEAIQALCYSPDGQLLAIGSRDNNIYVYQVWEDGKRYGRVGKCSGHSSFVTHLDWSADNQVIRSNSGDYELLYWNASTCRQVVQSSQLRDIQWATNSCTISFHTIGAWPEGADGTDVNHSAKSNDESLLATADDMGLVRLYSYPTAQPKSLCHSYTGHSSHVTAVAFMQDDTRLVSIGGNDTAILQWVVST